MKIWLRRRWRRILEGDRFHAIVGPLCLLLLIYTFTMLFCALAAFFG